MGNGDDFVMPLPPKGASPSVDDGESVGGNMNLGSDCDHFIESGKSKMEFDVWFRNQKEEEKIPFLFASKQEPC